MKNSLIKVLSFVMALTMIVGCFSAITFSAAEHTHTKGDKVGEPVPATCANIGYTLYECATCGETYPDDVVPKAADHTGIVDVPATAANCAYPAFTAGKVCEDCDTVIVESKVVEDSKPLGHKFVGAHKGVVCDLEYYYVCSICGKTAEECYKAENEDKFAEEEVYTEVESGSEDEPELIGLVNKFGVNILTYKAYFAKAAGVGHAWDYVVKTAPKTCEDGFTVATCKTCGEVEEIAILAVHQFGTKTFLSCEEYVGRKCELCGASETGEVNLNVHHVWTDVEMMDFTLQGLGYTTVRVNPTCNTTGYQVQKCDCGEYQKLELPKTAHSWSAWVAEGGEFPSAPNSEVCVTAKTLTKKCNLCQVEETVTGVALKEHVYVTEVVEPTCTTDGWTELTCIYPGCHYATNPVKSNYTAKLGHAWGEWETVGSADDHTVDYKKVRACANECGATETDMIRAAVTTAPAGTITVDGHYFVLDQMSDVIVAANCTTPAYYAYICVVDGCNATTPMLVDGAVSYVNNDKNTAVHDPAALVKLETVKAATCTATGTDKYICTNCNNVEVSVTTPAKGHRAREEWVDYKDANNNGKVDSGESLAAVEATCTSTGKTKGEVCPDCKTVMVPQQTVAINPANHKTYSNGEFHSVTPTKVVDQKATCSSVGYIKYYYSCCKQYVTDYPTDSDYANINASGHVWTTVKYKAVACGVNGNHAYQECKECKAIEFITTGDNACACGGSHTNVPVEITAAPHDFSSDDCYVPAVAETCTTAGYTAHYKCSVCGTTEGKVVIPAHGTQYKVTFKDTTAEKDGFNKLPTHFESGIKAGTFCEKCDKYADTPTDIKGINAAGWYIAPVAHSFVATAVNEKEDNEDYDCTLPTFTSYLCACGASYAVDYAPAAATSHKYEAAWHKFALNNSNEYTLDGKAYNKTNFPSDANAPEDTIMACNPDAVLYEYRACQNCGVKDIKNEKAPINHRTTINGAKVDILLDCKNIANFIDAKCEICTTKFTAADVTHKASASVKDATCTENGYMLNVCTDCGKYLTVDNQLPTEENPAVNTITPAFGHKPYVVVDDTKPYAPGNFAASADGKNLWAIDTNAVKYVVEEKAPTYGADGYIAYMCATCNEVVTYVIPFNAGIEFGMSATAGFTGSQVALTVKVSAKDYAFQTLTLYVGYGSGLKLADKKAELNYEFAATDNVTLRARDNDGYVTVMIYAPNAVETGKAKNTTISAEDAALVTLYFDVLPYAYGAGFELYVGEIYDAVEDAYNNNYNFADSIDEDDNYLVDYYTTLVGDANFDGYIDAADSVAVMEANYTANYNAALDFDGNGTVDLDDHMALVNYYTSDRTYFDFLELIGVDYMDYVNNYNLRVDLDGDRNITDNDRARIAIELEEELKDLSVEYGYACDIDDMIADIVEDLLNDGLRNSIPGYLPWA